MEISFIPPQEKDNCYRYKANIDGIVHNGYLTYELYPQKSKSRTILLVNGIHSKLDVDLNEEYQRLLNIIEECSSGRFGRVKNIVNRIVEGDINLKNVKVAVHKFGAVPIYVLPQKQTISLHGSNIDIEVGVYPHIFSPVTKNAKLKYVPPFLSSREEFLKSLISKTDLLFQRYLEDVGESFYDIENHLSLSCVYERAKEVEDIFGESINSKISNMIPSDINFHKYLIKKKCDQVLECDIFLKETDWIFTAKFARQFGLYFLNELYKHIGIKSFSDKYLDGFNKIKETFDSLMGNGWYSQSRKDRIDQVSSLFNALNFYYSNQCEKLMELSSDVLWTKRFIKFAQFIALLNQFNLDTSQGRIFISHQLDVPSTEILKSQIENYIQNNFSDKVKILYCKTSRVGLDVNSIIKPMIWISDSIEGIIPREPRPVSNLTKEKDYVWIALEAEHGLLLDKRLIFLVEDGTNLDKVFKDFNRKDLAFYSPEARITNEKRIERLVDSLKNHLHGKFDIKEDNRTCKDLDARLQQVITDEVNITIQNRHNTIILGFYSQFSENIRHTLFQIQSLVPYPIKHSKGWILQKLCQQYKREYPNLKSAENAFNRAWLLVKKRSLFIKGTPFPLIELCDRHNYSAILSKILKTLRPDYTNIQIKNWIKDILLKLSLPI